MGAAPPRVPMPSCWARAPPSRWVCSRGAARGWSAARRAWSRRCRRGTSFASRWRAAPAPAGSPAAGESALVQSPPATPPPTSPSGTAAGGTRSRAPGSAGVPTLAELGPQVSGVDPLTQAAQQRVATQAGLGQLGAGRAGVQLAEYDRKSDMDRALLQAQLNQAGFTQANQLAAQAFGQQAQLAGLQSGLANQQLGFATAQPQLAAGAIGMAQGLGQGDLAYRQAVQDAQQGANRMAAFEPIERLARFGQGLTGVGGMLGSVQTQTGPAAPQQSPLAGALQAGIGAFTLGKLFG